MVIHDMIGVAVAVLLLAGITVAIVNGTKTAAIIGATGDSFAKVVHSATDATAK